MENEQERKVFPVWKAIRRRFPPDHPFFSGGNVERELLAKQVTLEITEEERTYISNMQEEQCWQISCPIVGCGARLSGLNDLESHYFVRHTATCSVCCRVFPTRRLLSLHIAETHDSFFQAKVARNYPMYECLVEGCSGRFQSDIARLQHLVDKHKFPKTFSFHKKKHPSQKRRQKIHSKLSQSPRQHQRSAKDHKSKNAKPLHSSGSCEEFHEDNVKFDETSETCEAGEKATNMEIEVKALTSAISRLHTVSDSESSVPSVVTFGRRHTRGLTSVPATSRNKSKHDK
ncbi:hypothetical protein O6H91_05G077200 [Diphasiastrum complanatum]|uniref:Uncharacterized protein n=1 Tax=Diphasiastrum complanatum TaxID=34168 RepID=A0ACC2DPS3_DIPCM|nr:hypothetical protein O6H91_Y047600 [Diphasiastrum complanatum]KAJ7556276.1 hypothetical protein O6H91_05G077200 [Diphasiastrum complanatum]